MAKISNLKRIIKEDFPEDQQALVDKLAYALNPFMEQVSTAFNKQINQDNLSREILTVDVENASGGALKYPAQFKTSLNSRILGINLVKAENLTNLGTYPTQAPWVSWSINAGIFTVLNVTGIQDNNKYRLTIEVIS